MKLLLIGWDAAEWSLIRNLLERGMMPRLQHLLSQAVSGELSSVRPYDSAALWTSLVTGKRATDHGILSALEVDSSGERIRLANRSTLTARPVWTVLRAAGYRSQAFGWPASHPAEPLDGIVVSDQFAEFGEPQSIYPPRLVESLSSLRLEPTNIDAASLVTLVPRAAELNPIGDQRLFLVAQFLASTASLHAAATWALEHEPWDFVAVRYAGLARLISVFGRAHATTAGGEPCDDAMRFSELIPNAYRFFDMLLTRLVELAGPVAAIMLVSQQGGVPDANPTTRPNPGILIAAGPVFRASGGFSQASVCDVAPTILALFGLSPEPGTVGRADGADTLRRAEVLP